MAAVTIDMIKALRERTGAGMMDCKRALQEKDGNLEAAVDYLREKGIAKAATKATRIAAEGLTNVKFCEKCNKGIIVEVNCETDFVSSSEKFRKLVDDVTALLLKEEPKDLDAAKALSQSLFADATVAMGEKFDLRRFVIVKPAAGQGVASYIHMGGKISVLAILSKPSEELAKPLAMHIAANNPLYIDLKDVPSADREREKGVAAAEVAADPKLTGKPDQVKAMIVEKKVDKVLSESCLALQNYLMDDTKTVGQVLKENGLQVISFIRYQVGEGIAKAAEAC
jgi:elongation factor Ts